MGLYQALQLSYGLTRAQVFLDLKHHFGVLGHKANLGLDKGERYIR